MKNSLIKLMSLVLVITLMVTGSNISAYAISTEDEMKNFTFSDAESVVRSMLDAVNQDDMETFTHLMCSSEQAYYEMYFNDASLTNGIKQVEEVDVVNVYEVDNDLARTEWLTDQYSILSESKEIYSVIVEAACEVSKENQYFYNGINYFFIVLAAENNELKVVQFNRPSAELVNEIIEYDLCEENSLYRDELAGINVLENADAGLIINADGKILESGFETVQVNDEESIMPLYDNIQEPILNKYTSYSCPTTITVYCNKDSSNRVYTVDFDDFVKNCVTNEWPADSESKAYIVGAYCCKMDAWYKCIKPTSSSGAYDITTEQINYIHGKAILSGARDAVNSIHGKGMANSDKKIFFAHHGKGSRSSGNSKSGLLWQEGSVYWESQGKSVQWILDYYYKESPYSSGSVYLFSY